MFQENDLAKVDAAVLLKLVTRLESGIYRIVIIACHRRDNWVKYTLFNVKNILLH